MSVRALMLVALAETAVGCANGAAPSTRCQFVRHEGMCEATVTLDPREAESPDEATTLIVRWEWKGARGADGGDVAEVPDRVVQTHMTAREARALGESIDELRESRCVVEEAVAPDPCLGRARIVAVEAEP